MIVQFWREGVIVILCATLVVVAGVADHYKQKAKNLRIEFKLASSHWDQVAKSYQETIDSLSLSLNEIKDREAKEISEAQERERLLNEALDNRARAAAAARVRASEDMASASTRIEASEDQEAEFLAIMSEHMP